MIFILKPVKERALLSSYRAISLLHSIGKGFKKILLTRILSEVRGRRLLRDEQSGFRPRQSTSLQLARLVERMSNNFGEKRLTGAFFFDVAKAFDTLCVDGLVYKVTVLNTPSYLVKLFCFTCEFGLRSVLPRGYFLSPWHAGWRGVGGINLPCSLHSVCQ